MKTNKMFMKYELQRQHLHEVRKDRQEEASAQYVLFTSTLPFTAKRSRVLEEIRRNDRRSDPRPSSREPNRVIVDLVSDPTMEGGVVFDHDGPLLAIAVSSYGKPYRVLPDFISPIVGLVF